MKYLKSLFEAIKVPVTMFCFFFISGIGFSLGVSQSDPYQQLMHNKTILITALDLTLKPSESDDTEEVNDTEEGESCLGH